MKLFYTLFFFLFTIQLSFAQSSLEQLNNYIQEVKNGSYEPVPQSILSATENYQSLLESLETHQNDSLALVRTRAYNISKRIGQNAEFLTLRQQAIGQQITALDDADADIRIKAINGLTGFKNTDFTDEQQFNIINRFKPNRPHLEIYARLVGFLPSEEGIAPLKQVLSQTTDGWERFNIQLALARKGDTEATNAIINKMNTAPVNDGFVYDVVPVLVYSRSEEVFKFLEKIIFSEEANCSSANPDSNAKILCGYRVMEYLAPAIVDYPLATDKYGELLTNDYEQALTEVRGWFKANLDYELVQDTY